MRLTLTVRKVAMSIVQDKNARKREGSALLFLKRYGSHFPAGVQTLGGAFFNITNAESKSATDAFN